MKITNVEVYPVKLQTARTMSTAHYKSLRTTKDVYVKIETSEGITGYGATAPKYYITGETQEGCTALIREYFAPKLIGENPFNVEKIIALLDHIILFNNAAKAAIDLALHDLIGKALGVPVYDLLGGKVKSGIPAFDLIDLLPPSEAASVAAKRVAEGVYDIKVKAGSTPEEDIARVAAVREAVGNSVKLRVDSNQAWSPKKAIEVIRAMERFGIEFVEQPVRFDDHEGLREVTSAVGTLIMADESIKTDTDAMKLMRDRAVDAFNLKIAKIGGLYKAKRVAAMADMANMVCMAGCTLENNLVDTAAAHFYLSTRNVLYHEIKAPQLIVNDPASGLRISGGSVIVPAGPGFGLTVDEDALKRASQQ